MKDIRKMPIAVLDSGVGGVSVLAELLRVMPNEDYIFFGDLSNAPYGTKTKSEVLSITERNLEFLKKIGIKALVIACNTATSAAAKTLREKNPELIIIGIEPAIKPAAVMLNNPRVLVMATPLTLKEEKFCSLVERFSDKEEIIPLPCPGLASLIEKGELDSEEINDYLAELFAPYKNEKIDAIVLGCTHYPHVRSAIAKHFPKNTPILDGGSGTAKETRRRLLDAGLLTVSDKKGQVRMISTSEPERFSELARNFLEANFNTEK